MDWIRKRIDSDESLKNVQRSGLPMQNDVQHIEIGGDFEWLFNVACLIREGNLDVLNTF